MTAAAPPKSPDAIGTVQVPREDWLARQAVEPILDPGQPIIDPHHHLWQRRAHRYLLPELLADTGSGHDVRATVFVDCLAFYRPAAAGEPSAMRPVGETEFANGVAAMAASGVFGPTRACAGIVSHADLRLGTPVRAVLEAHLARGGRRFKGIRHAGGWDAHPLVADSHTQPGPGLYANARFREGFAQLAPLGLSFEAWQFHPQLADVAALAQAFPDTAIVLNHIGGPLGIGPYGGSDAARAEARAVWLAGIRQVAACPNVVVKLGGLGMPVYPFDFWQQLVPPTSEALAAAWKPWIEPCIEAFGPQRCLFESNFPVDKASTGYAVLWNAFKRTVAGASEAERQALFADTAKRVYRLDEIDTTRRATGA